MLVSLRVCNGAGRSVFETRGVNPVDKVVVVVVVVAVVVVAVVVVLTAAAVVDVDVVDVAVDATAVDASDLPEPPDVLSVSLRLLLLVKRDGN